MIVVDTNVIASLYLETAVSSAAEAVLRRDLQWAAPLLWRSEFRNVLASLMTSGRATLRYAIAATSAAEALLQGREYAVPSDEVLEAASASGCTAYACEFVVLARAAGCPLVTLDRVVIRAFPKIAVGPREFVG